MENIITINPSTPLKIKNVNFDEVICNIHPIKNKRDERDKDSIVK
jgi:hypothetical protein